MAVAAKLDAGPVSNQLCYKMSDDDCFTLTLQNPVLIKRHVTLDYTIT